VDVCNAGRENPFAEAGYEEVVTGADKEGCENNE
jgi:hypothetical protein